LYADGGAAGNLTVRAASVCGRGHARMGESREDAFAVQLAPNGMIVVSVADGVGDRAARFSAIGAHLASLLSCQLICAKLEVGQFIDPDGICAEIARQMPIEAKRFILTPYDNKSLATTLISAWVSSSGTYEGFMIGDGGVFTLTDGQVSPVIRGQGAAFSDTEALPSGYTQPNRFRGQLAAGSAMLIATDGLAVPMLAPDVATALGETWRQPPSVLDFLYDISFERRGEMDDRTVAAVWINPHQPLS
jgi:serine/threonine protein phosphatase PrpC